jgi:WD40 repeat protein
VITQASRAIASDPSAAIAWLQRLTRLDRPRVRELAIQAAERGIAYELSGPKGDIEHVVAVGTSTAYTTSRDGALWRWHLNAFRGDKLGEQAGAIAALAVTADGFWLAAAGQDRIVRLWDLEQVQLRTFAGHTLPVRALAFSPDGNTLASLGDDGIRLWNVQRGGESTLVAGGPRAAIAWSADSTRLWLAGDGFVMEHEVATGKHVSHAVAGTVHVLAASPTGKHVAAGTRQGGIYLVGERMLEGHIGVRALAWTVDGKLLSLGDDTRVLVQDPAGGGSRSLEAGARITSIATFGDHVAAGGADGKLRIWQTGAAMRTLGSHRGAILALAFTADGSKLVTAGDDDRLRLWPLAPPPPVPSGDELATWLTARTNVVP